MKFPKTTDKKILNYKGIYIKANSISDIRHLFNFCEDMNILSKFKFSEHVVEQIYKTYYYPGKTSYCLLCVINLLDEKPYLTEYSIYRFAKEYKDEWMTVQEFIKAYKEFLPAKNAYLNGDDSLIEFEDMFIKGDLI